MFKEHLKKLTKEIQGPTRLHLILTRDKHLLLVTSSPICLHNPSPLGSTFSPSTFSLRVFQWDALVLESPSLGIFQVAGVEFVPISVASLEFSAGRVAAVSRLVDE
jgi:hypothetical protein